MSDSRQTLWPETTVFWGAGATAGLGMPVTAQQGAALAALGGVGAWAAKTLRERVTEAKLFRGIETELINLLVVLGDESDLADITPEANRAAEGLFPSVGADRRRQLVAELRREYDWDCLRQVIRICPGTEQSPTSLQDLFNILDMHILSGKGFHVPPRGDSAGGEVPFLTPSRLPAARNALTMVLGLLFHAAWRRCRTDKMQELSTYAKFCDILAELMQEEGVRFARTHPLDYRRFYLFSCAVTSMNFDLILPWLLFNSHKELNDGSPPHVGTPAAPLKLFHDHGQTLALRPIDEDRRSDIWYPFTEAAAQRLNDPKYRSDRRVRLGKLYMPHGCLSWRDCPNCGRVTISLGDVWRRGSETLLPPAVIPIPDVNHKPQSGREEAGRKLGNIDAVQCSYCGELTYMRDTPLILQSSFKGNHPSFLEEIQRDMRVCLENTKHVVFLGYSLPADDVIYRSMLAARKARTKPRVYCSVVVGTTGPDHWLAGTDAAAHAKQYINDQNSGAATIQAAIDIFGKSQVRAYTAGIPKVFGTPPNRGQILNLLYPVNAGIDCFTPNGVCRETGT